MDKQFAKLIELNVSGRVFALCQSRGVMDPAIIGYYKDILLQSVQEKLCEDCSPSDFTRVLDEQIAWLEAEIDQNRPEPDQTTRTEQIEAEKASPPAPESSRPSKKKPCYIPKAKSMPERLAEQRAGMEQLLEKDCVTLKLITPSQAKTFKRRILGQRPQQAEEELVAELRNILHQQVRAFIRKHDGGPWDTATLQHDVRMDIAATRSLRSLTKLARDLLRERQEWLKKTSTSITGRLFGGKVRLHKS